MWILKIIDSYIEFFEDCFEAWHFELHSLKETPAKDIKGHGYDPDTILYIYRRNKGWDYSHSIEGDN